MIKVRSKIELESNDDLLSKKSARLSHAITDSNLCAKIGSIGARTFIDVGAEVRMGLNAIKKESNMLLVHYIS